MHRRIPSWWREAGESGTKQLYQPEKPVLYIVPITSILGRLPLIPAGDHGTIPAALRGSKRDLFPLGKCDEDRQPGTGSKLFYISSWAMCWPTDHPMGVHQVCKVCIWRTSCTLCDEPVVYTCILNADFEYANEHFVQTTCKLNADLSNAHLMQTICTLYIRPLLSSSSLVAN